MTISLLAVASGTRADSDRAAAAAAALADALAEEGDLRASRVERRRAELLAGATAEPRLDAATPSAPVPVRWPPGAMPVRIIVGFYRWVIAPAIGSRCILQPSCSAYSMQAARERGWLGLPMTGDRMIREPSVVVAREKPVKDEQGRTRIADPVSDHIGARKSRETITQEPCGHAHQ